MEYKTALLLSRRAGKVRQVVGEAWGGIVFGFGRVGLISRGGGRREKV